MYSISPFSADCCPDDRRLKYPRVHLGAGAHAYWVDIQDGGRRGFECEENEGKIRVFLPFKTVNIRFL